MSERDIVAAALFLLILISGGLWYAGAKLRSLGCTPPHTRAGSRSVFEDQAFAPQLVPTPGSSDESDRPCASPGISDFSLKFRDDLDILRSVAWCDGRICRRDKRAILAYFSGLASEQEIGAELISLRLLIGPASNTALRAALARLPRERWTRMLHTVNEIAPERKHVTDHSASAAWSARIALRSEPNLLQERTLAETPLAADASCQAVEAVRQHGS
jgi:hypothetical protein